MGCLGSPSLGSHGLYDCSSQTNETHANNSSGIMARTILTTTRNNDNVDDSNIIGTNECTSKNCTMSLLPGFAVGGLMLKLFSRHGKARWQALQNWLRDVFKGTGAECSTSGSVLMLRLRYV